MSQALIDEAVRIFQADEAAPALETGSTVYGGSKSGVILDMRERPAASRHSPTGITRDYLVEWGDGTRGWANRCEITTKPTFKNIHTLTEQEAESLKVKPSKAGLF